MNLLDKALASYLQEQCMVMRPLRPPAARETTGIIVRIISLAKVFANRIDQLIRNLAVLHNGAFQSGFEHEACFFQDTLRSSVRTKRTRKNASDVKGIESIFNHFTHRSGSDAMTPKRFSEPVTQFGIHDVNVVLQVQTDAASGIMRRRGWQPIGTSTSLRGEVTVFRCSLGS